MTAAGKTSPVANGYRRCKWCNDPLSEDLPGTYKYCPDKNCKYEYWDSRRYMLRKDSAQKDFMSGN